MITLKSDNSSGKAMWVLHSLTKCYYNLFYLNRFFFIMVKKWHYLLNWQSTSWVEIHVVSPNHWKSDMQSSGI